MNFKTAFSKARGPICVFILLCLLIINVRQVNASPNPVQASSPNLFQEATGQSLGRGINPQGFTAAYYDSAKLTSYLFSRPYTTSIDFFRECWNEIAPYKGCKFIPEMTDGIYYSIRWSASLVVKTSGTYTFHLNDVDDAARMLIDGAEIIDHNWYVPNPDKHPSPQSLYLSQGSHAFIVEYEQRPYYRAALEVLWSGPDFATEVIPVASTELPLVFVHGFRGFPPQITNCTAAKYLPVTLQEAKDYFQGIGDRLKTDGGYSDQYLYYARLVSNSCYTPPVVDNVPNLMAAIDEAKAASHQSKVVLIAHSMGGLVARAYIEGPDYRGDVDTLFTFGSPHLGTPDDGLAFLLNGLTLGSACNNYQPAACDFSLLGMTLFNMDHHRNNTVIYHAISGDAPFLSRSPLGMATDALIFGPDDGIIPLASGRAMSLGTFDRWTTDEVHGPGSDGFGSHTYFIRDGNASTSYTDCIKKILVDGAQNCGSVSATPADQPDIPPSLAQHSPVIYGTLQTGQTATQNISLEGGPTLFTSQWQNGSLTFTLVDPNNQPIDATYAANNPGIVTYTEDASSATYYFPNAISGTWQVVLHSVNATGNGASFGTFAAFDSNVNLSGSVDGQWFLPGTPVTITAVVDGLPSSVSVTARIIRSDGTTDTLPLSSIGNGQFQAAYNVPNIPGYTEIDLSATGTTASSLPFTQGTSLSFQISPHTFTLNNSYADSPVLYPGLTRYQYLNIAVGIDAASAGRVGLSADLVDGSDNLVAHTVTIEDVPAGTNTVTLQFNGGDIFASQHNGPYTLTNILVTDQTTTTLATQEAQAVYTTATYSYTDFITQSSFSDITTSYWANSFIERLYLAGVTGGCSTNPMMYCPETKVNRAQMAIFLLRGEHGNTYTPPLATGTVFQDIPADYWAAAWIEQLSAEGITGGCGNGKYCPETPVTRDQMAIFLLRAKYGNTYTPPSATGVFTDVPTNFWAAAWIEALAAEGITGGCGVGKYCPGAVVTRAQMAVFLVKTFNLP
jgi:triacylglycerol esterase/lipase EstA (alpha/beta hydrolase family)